jgi:hypothetical protein
VNAFGSLPKPVQQGVAGLGALVGVAGVAGGAVLIAVGQVQKFKLALETMGVSAETSSRAVGLVGKAAKGLGMAGAVVGVLALADALNQAGANGSKLPAIADGLVDVGGQIQLSGQALDTFGAGFENLPKKIDVAGRSLRWSFTTGQKSIKNARQDLDDLDSTLAGLVQGGHSQAAAELFEEISTAAKNGGVSTKDLDKAFGKYKNAVASANTETKLAAQVTGDASDSAVAYAEALEQQSQASKEAADAIRDQSNALKGMFDPIFAVQDALQKQKDAQDAVNKALKEHGRKSEEYRQAQRDALRATVDLDGAVQTLRAGLMDGSVSLKTVNGRLDDYARAGLITTDQAAAFKRQLALAAEQAGVLSGKLDILAGKNITATVRVRVLSNGDFKVDGGTLVAGAATGGYVTGPGSATSDSIPARLSNGEYVINAAATAKHRQLLDMINGGGTFRPWTPTSSSVDNSRVFSPTLNIQAAPGENAQRSGVRALREALFLEGHG